jgi:histone H3/H4
MQWGCQTGVLVMKQNLFQQIIHLTGLPSAPVERQLKAIIDEKKIKEDSMTLDDLRTIVAELLLEVLPNAQEELSSSTD